MMKSFKNLFAIAALASASMVAITVAAEAQEARRNIPTTKVETTYREGNVKRQVRNVTRYRDVERPRVVTHTKRIVNVTRVQPVTRVNTVTRVHNKTAVIRENRYGNRTEMLPTRHVRTSKTIVNRAHVAPTAETVYRYKTVRNVKNMTRYRDVNNTRYVRHVNRIVRVDRVQPVVRENVVTRIHERPRVVTRNQYVHRTEVLPERRIHTSKTVRINGGTEYRGTKRLYNDTDYETDY
ncbi:hypothetical protein GCM10011491_33300 [Brucella endophytica]|uniref:Uncharacterized protein n=1 Tax=Brucella endophytica TaxID=1963359 RepID=A0A916WI99_9HYPH|nr:hypothetical protein [Brucella endophytica]GGB02539.1 hypothetical protein GCM10011491_33300 [Brucella endophytica]